MKNGRPPMYDSPSKLQDKVEEYFQMVEKSKVNVTITGLIIFCGFCDRQSFYDYEKKNEFSHIIKRARAKVAQAYENNLHGTSPTGSIFALKNMGWSDKQEIEHSSKGKSFSMLKVTLAPDKKDKKDKLDKLDKNTEEIDNEH